MQGKTHAAAAVAAALLITRPTTPLILGATVAAAALGGLAPDVDALYSDARKVMNNATAVICLVLIAGLLLVQGEVIQLSSLISAGRNALGDLFFGPALLICFLIIGGMMPHRTMTHSIAAVLTVWQCLAPTPAVGLPFVIGYSSHLLLDLLNRKGLQLFFPFRKKVCFGFCSSERLVNRIMFVMSGAFAALYVSLFFVDTIVPGFTFL